MKPPTDIESTALQREILADFAEYVDGNDGRFEVEASQVFQEESTTVKANECRRERRNMARLRRQRYEVRKCPVCGTVFRVLLGGRKGARPRVYDSAACRLKAFRERKRGQEEVCDAK